MAQVTLRINGYNYVLGCQDGEEDHLQSMAAQLESRIEGIKTAAGQTGESRMLVMAALMMTDDLYELEKKLATKTAEFEAAKAELAGAKADLAGAQSTCDTAMARPARPDPKLGRKLGKLAQRAEEIAARLDHP